MPSHKNGKNAPQTPKTSTALTSTPLRSKRRAQRNITPSPISRWPLSPIGAPRKATKKVRQEGLLGTVRLLETTPRRQSRNRALGRIAYNQIVNGLAVTKERILLMALTFNVFVSLDRAETYVNPEEPDRLSTSARAIISEVSRRTGLPLPSGLNVDSTICNLSSRFDEVAPTADTINRDTTAKALAILNERAESAAGQNQCGSFSQVNRL